MSDGADRIRRVLDDMMRNHEIGWGEGGAVIDVPYVVRNRGLEVRFEFGPVALVEIGDADDAGILTWQGSWTYLIAHAANKPIADHLAPSLIIHRRRILSWRRPDLTTPERHSGIE